MRRDLFDKDKFSVFEGKINVNLVPNAVYLVGGEKLPFTSSYRLLGQSLSLGHGIRGVAIDVEGEGH
jgi:hypothetical protein